MGADRNELIRPHSKRYFGQDEHDLQDKIKIFEQIGDPDLVIPAL